MADVDINEDLLPKPPAPLAMEKFRGVQQELEQLYKVCNGGGNKTLEQRVEAAYAFLNLGLSFLEEFEDENEFIDDTLKEMDAHPYPKLQRSVTKTADGFPVVRLQPVRTPTTGDIMRNDVLPQYLVQGEALVLSEILRDFYLHHMQSWIQSVAFKLMKHDILRRQSRTVQRFSQYFTTRPDETTDEDVALDDEPEPDVALDDEPQEGEG